MEEPRKQHAERKKPDSKDHMPYDPIHKKVPEQANPKRQKTYSWLSGAGVG